MISRDIFLTNNDDILYQDNKTINKSKNNITIFRKYNFDLDHKYQYLSFLIRKNPFKQFIIAKDFKLYNKLSSKKNIIAFHFSDRDDNKFKYLRLKKYKNIILTYATHNEKEIIWAIKYNIDIILLSPIFKTKNYSDSSLIGIKKFRRIKNKYNNINLYPLGGINKDNYKLIKKNKNDKIAAIKYFL